MPAQFWQAVLVSEGEIDVVGWRSAGCSSGKLLAKITKNSKWIVKAARALERQLKSATKTKSEAARCCEASVGFDERESHSSCCSWSRRAAEPGAFCWEPSSQKWKRKKKNKNPHVCLLVNQMLHRLAGRQQRRLRCVRKTTGRYKSEPI